jgi:MoaA/NifB/PqqE/SkfB family radical SAM enzyme
VRVAVSLGRACDSDCVFCAQDGLPREREPDERVVAALEAAHASGARAVTFVGGEPARDNRLPAYVERARARFDRVGVQTNGVALADGSLAELRRRGLTDLHLSLHGAEAAVHDWHTQRPGSFDAASRTLSAARAAGLEVVVVSLLTRSSFRVLSNVPRMLASRGVAAWCVDVPRWRGRAATGADRVVPRLALALPFALHALDAAAKLGLPAFVRGAPRCLLGPFGARSLDVEPRSFGPGCEGCPSRSMCAGVDAEYLQRFGPDELAPCGPMPASRSAREDALRACFVGVGEMAPPSQVAAYSTPQRARVGLPLLGRPAPARAEVSAGAPKQSGEALRAILPGLFADAPAGGGPDER